MHCICNRNYPKKSTLGWVSVVLEKVEKCSPILPCNIYLRLLNHIRELVVDEKQNPKQFHALEAQII